MAINSKGKITKAQLSQSLIDELLAAAGSNGGGSVAIKKYSKTITTNTDRVFIGNSFFTTDTDQLLVFKNSVYLELNEDYILNQDDCTISPLSGVWEATAEEPDTFNFICLMNAPGDVLFSGAKLYNGTVTEEKLSLELQAEIKRGAIDGGRLVDNTVTGSKLSNNTITEDKLSPEVQEKLNTRGGSGSEDGVFHSYIETISTTGWSSTTNTDGMYTKTVTHGLNCNDNLIVSAIDTDTKRNIAVSYKVTGLNTIEVESDKKVNMKLMIINSNEAEIVGGTTSGTGEDLYSKTITKSMWTIEQDMMVCNINHGLNTKNVILSVHDTDTGLNVMVSYKIVDANTIQLRSNESYNCKVVLTYKTITNTVGSSSSVINDNVVSIESTYSSEKINNEFEYLDSNYYYSNICQSIINRVLNREFGNISMNFIGDSFSAHGLVSDISNNYIDLLNKQIKKVTNNGRGVTAHPTVTNFQEPHVYGLTINGTTGLGSKGACKKSLIMSNGSSITVKKDFDYLDLFIEAAGVNATLEFSVNKQVFRTINASNLGFTYLVDGFVDIPDGQEVVITCKNSNVEISALTRINKTGNDKSIYINRIAVSGTTTEYWVDNLDNINNICTMGGGTKGFVILALGTNNIYSPEATTSEKYYNDLKRMSEYFIEKGMYVILVSEPLSNESIFPVVKEPHKNYKNKLIQLSKELKLPVIYLDKLNLIENMDDGVHPNESGNYKMFQLYKTYLGIPDYTSVYKDNSDFNFITSYKNNWNYFVEQEYGVKYKKIDNIVYLEGLCSGGVVSDTTVIFKLPLGYRPYVDKFFVVSSNHYPATISIKTDGDVICKNNIDNTFISFDNIIFSTK